MNWVPSRQCCRRHKSQWLTGFSWALILFHPLPMHHKMKKNRVILSIHPLNLGAEFFPWSWIRIWSLFWFSRASESSKPVRVHSSVRWCYSIPGLAREKEERHFAASFFSPAETKWGKRGIQKVSSDMQQTSVQIRSCLDPSTLKHKSLSRNRFKKKTTKP